MTTVLEMEDVSAGYGDRIVVRGVTATARSGEVVGLFGANGAGKTTLLSAVAGLLPVGTGRLSLFGSPVAARVSPAARARAGVSLVPQGRGLFRQLTVGENLRLAYRGRQRATTIEEVLASFPALAPLLRRPAGLLSGGEQQMLAVARALVSRPRLLLIDELSMGLAPQIAESLLATLRTEAVRRDIGVVVVEQHIPLALRFVDRGWVLSHGELSRDSTTRELANDPGFVSATYLGDH